MQARNRCSATGLKIYRPICGNCGYNGKTSGKAGTDLVPALPDAFHSFSRMICSYSRTYFFWIILSMCIYRIKLASCTENFRQVAGENLPPRRKGPPVMGSASRSGWQSVGSVIVVGNRDAILGQNSLQQLSAFQVKV